MARIQIGGRTFRTKKDATRFIKELLYSNLPETPIRGEAREFLLALLQRHRWADEKVGCGVAEVFVREQPMWRNQCFWVRRVDGTETDWSYLECLTARTPRDDFSAAARTTIQGQIQAFRDRAFAGSPTLVCPLTGREVEASRSHVDHVAPATFQALVKDFIAQEGLNPDRIEILGFGDGESSKSFADPALARRWAAYHQAHAKLRILSSQGNLSLAKRALATTSNT